MVLDVGHETNKEDINPFTEHDKARGAVLQCGDCLHHVHLHETLPIKEKPDHRPPLHPDGIIRWQEVFRGLKESDYQGVFLFEDGRGEEPKEWVRMTGAFPGAFFKRYRA